MSKTNEISNLKYGKTTIRHLKMNLFIQIIQQGLEFLVREGWRKLYKDPPTETIRYSHGFQIM